MWFTWRLWDRSWVVSHFDCGATTSSTQRSNDLLERECCDAGFSTGRGEALTWLTSPKEGLGAPPRAGLPLSGETAIQG